jgi:hypothetical protein
MEKNKQNPRKMASLPNLSFLTAWLFNRFANKTSGRYKSTDERELK